MSYRRLHIEDGVTRLNADIFNNLQDGIDEALEKLVYSDSTPISKQKSAELILGTDYNAGDIIKFTYRNEYYEFVSIKYTTPDGVKDISPVYCPNEYCETKMIAGQYCLSISVNEYVDVYILQYKTISDLSDVVDKLRKEIDFIIGDGVTSGAILPPITEDDEGKLLHVIGGKAVWKELPTYNGRYKVIPDVVSQSLQTCQKFMEDDITIAEIPYSDVSNTSGGSTVYIGKEIK